MSWFLKIWQTIDLTEKKKKQNINTVQPQPNALNHWSVLSGTILRSKTKYYMKFLI